MTDTPPGNADQGDPQQGGQPAGPRWPDRPEFGQPTMPRQRPQFDQPPYDQTGQAAQPPPQYDQPPHDQQPTQVAYQPPEYNQPGYGQQAASPGYGQQPTPPDYPPPGGQLPGYGQYGQQDQYQPTQYAQPDQYQQTQYAQPGQYGHQAQYGQQGQYGQPGGQLPSYGQFGQQGQYGQAPGIGASYQQGGWSPGTPAPGGVPLRPLGLGDILSGTFTLIRQNPASTVGLIALGTFAGAILAIIVGFIANRAGSSGGAALADIPAFVIDAAVGGGVLAALGKSLVGRKIGIADALQQSRFGWMILTGLIYWVIIFLIWFVPVAVLKGYGVLISFPLGAWIGIMLCLMFPVVVLERQNPIAAIGRSWQLVKGSFWRFFGIFALLFAVIFVLFFIVGLIFTIIAGIGFASSRGNGAVAGGIAIGAIIAFAIFYFIISSVLVALWTALVVLLYADVRMRKEGMDLVLQQAAQSGQLTGDEFATYRPNQAAGGYSGGGYPGGGSPGYPGSPPAY